MIAGMLAAAAVVLTLPSWGNGAPDLLVDAPAGYQLRHTEGPDVDVFYVSKPRGTASLGVYVGHHPTSGECVQAAGRLSDIHWRVSNKRDGKRMAYGADAVLDGLFAGAKGAGVSDLLVHLFVRAANSEDVDLLKKVATSLRVSAAPSRGHDEFRSFTLGARRQRCE